MDLPRRHRGRRGRRREPRLHHAAEGADRRRRSQALDLLLTQIEKTIGLEVGRIGIEAQIENAARPDQRRRRSPPPRPRVETIIFGPADFMASINMKSLVVGEQPPGYDVGDAYHYILMRILMAARAHDLQAIDGPVPADPATSTASSGSPAARAALGFDGKWVLHPGQIDAANEVYSPLQEDYDHAENYPRRLRVLHVRGGRQRRARSCSATR